MMEKAGLEKSRYAGRFGRILISRLIGNKGRPGAKVPVAALALTTAAMPVLAAALIFPTKIIADADDDQVRTFTVDVALGLPFFQNDVDPAENALDPNLFSPGDTFIQYGNIYPKGTIPDGATDFDPDTPGAIGKYIVRGTWTTNLENFELAAAHKYTPAAQMALVTEILNFDNHGSAIMTDGMYPNAYFSARRVVLGGTGRFRGVVGEVEEQNIGENARTFCNFRLTFRLEKAAAEHGR